MALASTRPILRFAERGLYLFATLGGNTIAASWLSILIVGPLFSSLITEPGAMTISALMLVRHSTITSRRRASAMPQSDCFL